MVLSAHSAQSVTSSRLDRRASAITISSVIPLASMQLPQRPTIGAVVRGGGDHPVEVVVAVGELLAGDGATDGVPEAEDAHVDVVAFGEVAGEAQPVVGAFVAVGGALEDDEDVHDATGGVDGEVGSGPFREAVLEPSRWAATSAQQADGVVGEHAVRAPAIGDDLDAGGEVP